MSFLKTSSAAEILAFQPTAGYRSQHANDRHYPPRLGPQIRPEPCNVTAGKHRSPPTSGGSESGNTTAAASSARPCACGTHDIIAGACTRFTNELRYGVKNTPNCRDNFLQALADFGLGKKDIVANLNFFMNVPVHEDGRMYMAEGFSQPGDYVELHAERDVLAVIPNCAQVHNPVNGYNPTPIRVVVYRRV